MSIFVSGHDFVKVTAWLSVNVGTHHTPTTLSYFTCAALANSTLVS